MPRYQDPRAWSARRLDRVAGLAGALPGFVEALAQLLPGLTAALGRDEAGAPGPNVRFWTRTLACATRPSAFRHADERENQLPDPALPALEVVDLGTAQRS